MRISQLLDGLFDYVDSLCAVRCAFIHKLEAVSLLDRRLSPQIGRLDKVSATGDTFANSIRFKILQSGALLCEFVYCVYQNRNRSGFEDDLVKFSRL